MTGQTGQVLPTYIIGHYTLLKKLFTDDYGSNVIFNWLSSPALTGGCGY